MKKALLALGAAAASLPAFSQSTTMPTFGLGVSAGVYFPTDATIRHAFSSSIFTWGIAPVAIGRPKENALTPSFSIIGADQNGSNFLLVPFGLGYEFKLGDPNSDFVPYARLDAGACYFNYHVETAGGTVDGNRFGASGDAEIGVEFMKSLRLSAKYYIFTEESGLNFNGLQISLTYALIRF